MIVLRLAWRNLWRHGKRTWLTVSAMVFSNLLLIFMIALQLGSYEMMIENTLRLATGHLQIQHPEYQDNPAMRYSIDNITPLTDTLRHQHPALKFTQRSSAFVLAASDSRTLGVQVMGVDVGHESELSTLPGLLSRGSYLADNHSATIVIGETLANNLQVSPGDELTLLGSAKDGSFAATVVTISGMLSSGNRDLDRSIAHLPAGFFDLEFGMQGSGHAIIVRAPSLPSVQQWQQSLASSLAQIDGAESGLVVLRWQQLIPGLQQAIDADFTSAWFMYAVLIVLVAFSVLNTQLMSVLERTREFGVVLALGLKPAHLGRLVFIETGLMAAIGAVIGVALGTALVVWLNQVGFVYPGMEEMGEKFNLPSRMYPQVSVQAIITGPAVVYLACLCAAIYPTWRLYQLEPVEAMRAV